jgi:hypothetical protein
MTIKEIDTKIAYLKSFSKRLNKEISKLKTWVSQTRTFMNNSEDI